MEIKKADKRTDGRDVDLLCRAIAGFGSPGEIRAFLEDLCTPSEISAMADRWKVAQLLEGGMPYREIYEKTGVSTATVTRVARALAFGAGGYRAAIEAPSLKPTAKRPGARA